MIDKTYVGKCEKATEIQEAWEPKSGDLCYTLHVHVLTHDIVEYLCIVEERKKELIWLPHQRQLQDMVTPKNSEGKPIFSTWGVYANFCAWYEAATVKDAAMMWVSWDTLWLCYAMATLHKKRWDKESKEWVEINE
jgi:hypothetical protein